MRKFSIQYNYPADWETDKDSATTRRPFAARISRTARLSFLWARFTVFLQFAAFRFDQSEFVLEIPLRVVTRFRLT